MGYGTTVILQEGIVIAGNVTKKIRKLIGDDLDIYKYVRPYNGYTFISTQEIQDRVDLCKGYLKNGEAIPCSCSEGFSIGLLKYCTHNRGSASQLLMVKGYDYTVEQQQEIITRAKEAFRKCVLKACEEHVETIIQWVEKSDLVMVGDILLIENW